MQTHAATNDSAVAVQATRSGAEAAVIALGQGGFDPTKVSIVGRGCRGEDHRFLVVVAGSAQDVVRARRILAAACTGQLPIHQAA